MDAMELDAPGAREPTPPPPPPPPTTRSGRRRRLPKRLNDFLPSSLNPLPMLSTLAMQEAREQQQQTEQARQEAEIAAAAAAALVTPEPDNILPARPPPIVTAPNSMGVYREYPDKPFQDPDDCTSLDQLCDAPTFESSTDPNISSMGNSRLSLPVFSTLSNPFLPFLNATIFRLMNWFYSGSQMKSAAELDRLVKEVLLADDFDINNLKKFSATREMERMDNYVEGSVDDLFKVEDGWHDSTVKIKVPAEDNQHDPGGEGLAPEFSIPGLRHRSFLETIKAGLRDESFRLLHLTPFRCFWKPSEDVPAERIYGEQYTSDELLEEHEKVQALPREPGDTMERIVLPVMLWSDSTHLADFGNASLWPIYMFFGGLSKYTRAKPTSGSCHHLAYIPSVSYMNRIMMLKQKANSP